jgi:hypothetical protein
VTVLPSVDLAMTIIPRQASPTSKSMLLSATNKIPADELASRYGIIDPISSPEQIPPDMQRSGDGCFCITGMLYLGAGQVNGDIVGVYRDSNQTEKHVANTSEKISLFIPIELNDPSEIIANPSSLLLHQSSSPWIMKSSENYSDSSSLSTEKIFERFTSMSYANHCLMIEMNKSRIKLKETQNSSNENQPRLISQVRKERNTMRSTTSADISSFMEPESLDGIDLVKYDELKRGQLSLGISWITYWKGRIHHGITLIHHQQILKYHASPDTIVPLISPKTSFPSQQSQLSDVITVGFNHHQAIKWDFTQGRCPVTIMVLIHSIHPTKSFVISIEALEWLDMMTTKALNRRKRPPLKGLHWEGKSRYIDLTLSPMSTISLPFLALISRKGVFNIKRFVFFFLIFATDWISFCRFRISVNSEIETNPPTIKILDGQSLISVESK